MLRFILALFVVIVLVGAVLAATGVITVRNTDDKTSVTIDKKELKDQAGKAVEKTKEAGGTIVDKANQAVRKAGESLRSSPEDRPSPAPTETPKSDRARQSDNAKSLPADEMPVFP